ncbi:MAG: hypothetical protein HWD84_01450 [Flavobacteriaceae bacterium]|nr:hypothetical protein [Flavobacteriaceae bacterium]
MLKITAFILSSVILLQSVTFSSSAIVEIASFIEHYNYHKLTKDDSFVEFVSLHYGDLKAKHTQDHPEEHKDHQQLPLNNLHSTSILYVNCIDSSIYNLSEFNHLDSYLNNFRYTPGSSSFNPLDLIQPPRIV